MFTWAVSQRHLYYLGLEMGGSVAFSIDYPFRAVDYLELCCEKSLVAQKYGVTIFQF